MLTPIATAAAESQIIRAWAMCARTRRNRSSAVHDPSTATSSESPTKAGSCGLVIYSP
jgi:hypothetical protein